MNLSMAATPSMQFGEMFAQARALEREVVRLERMARRLAQDMNDHLGSTLKCSECAESVGAAKALLAATRRRGKSDADRHRLRRDVEP